MNKIQIAVKMTKMNMSDRGNLGLHPITSCEF